MVCNVLLRFPGWTTCFLKMVCSRRLLSFGLLCQRCYPISSDVYKPCLIKKAVHLRGTGMFDAPLFLFKHFTAFCWGWKFYAFDSVAVTFHRISWVKSLSCLSHPELEWRLSESGAVKTDLEENPKKQIEDKLMSSIRCSLPTRKDSDSEDEDY